MVHILLKESVFSAAVFFSLVTSSYAGCWPCGGNDDVLTVRDLHTGHTSVAPTYIYQDNKWVSVNSRASGKFGAPLIPPQNEWPTDQAHVCFQGDPVPRAPWYKRLWLMLKE